MKGRVTLFTAVFASVVLYCVASFANVGDSRISLDEAIVIATSNVPGFAIGVEWEKGHYEIKLDRDEERMERVFFDPRSGAMVGEMNLVRSGGDKESVDMKFKRALYKVTVLKADGITEVVLVDAASGETGSLR